MNIQALAMEALPYNSAVLMRKVDTPCHSCGVRLTVGATTRRCAPKYRTRAVGRVARLNSRSMRLNAHLFFKLDNIALLSD
jgi:hypothetical protein